MRPNTTTTFWSRVSKSDGCWLWTGGTSSSEYGRFRLEGQHWQPHQLSYTLIRGPIPDGQCVLHHCDVPTCVRPDHLFLGTRADNNADRDKKGRHVPLFGERNGNATKPERRPRGESHGEAKLTESDVVEIRRSHAAREASIKALAHRYGVHLSTLYRIVRRQLWPHVV